MGNRREVEIAGKSLVIWEHEDVLDEEGNSQPGSWIWDCALVLAYWLDTPAWTSSSLEGKRVVELGSGTGLPGLAAASLGAQVVLTDKKGLLPGLDRNVVANNLSERVKVQELEWGESCAHLSPPVDFVFMSDLLYDIHAMPALVKTLTELSDKNTQIWLSYELRPGTTECFQEFGKQGFVWYKVPNEKLHPNWNSEDIGVFKLWREMGGVPCSSPEQLCNHRLVNWCQQQENSGSAFRNRYYSLFSGFFRAFRREGKARKRVLYETEVQSSLLKLVSF